jgi:hypothetical protein
MLPCPPQNQSNSSDRMNSRLAVSNTSGSYPPKPPNGNWSTLTSSAVCPTCFYVLDGALPARCGSEAFDAAGSFVFLPATDQ